MSDEKETLNVIEEEEEEEPVADVESGAEEEEESASEAEAEAEESEAEESEAEESEAEESDVEETIQEEDEDGNPIVMEEVEGQSKKPATKRGKVAISNISSVAALEATKNPKLTNTAFEEESD
jgi:hypothetical protein